MKKENLKRIILGLCFCMAAVVPSYAQWSFGVKAGVASSTVDIKHWGNKQKVGLLAGGVVSYELSEHFDLQGELFYANRGYKTNIYLEVSDENPHDWKFSLSYLNLPLLLKWYPIGQGVYVEAGPQVGYLLDNSNDIEGWPKDETLDQNPWGDYKRWDFGLVGGIGYSFNMGLFVDVRYDLGLTNVLKEAKSKQRAWEFTVGYMF